MDRAPAKVIAKALAQTGVHYRRQGLMAGVAALGACILTVMVELASQKVASMALAAFFTVVAYTTIRLANRYVDPSASPVLLALAKEPDKIAKVFFERRRGSLIGRLVGTGGGAYVVIELEVGARLMLRVDPHDATAQASELIDALDAIAPDADVQHAIE